MDRCQEDTGSEGAHISGNPLPAPVLQRGSCFPDQCVPRSPSLFRHWSGAAFRITASHHTPVLLPGKSMDGGAW